MSFLHRIASRFRDFFRQRTFSAEMEDEMRSHIELRTQANIKAGMNPEEARYAALRLFGWSEFIKEDCREQRGVPWMENLVQDARFAFRQLRKHPGFTAVAVLTLGLGIGANTAMFSVSRAVLFRALGFEAPDRLMWFRLTNHQTGATEDRLSWRDIEDIRESTKSFESVGAFSAQGATWEEGDRIERFPGLGVTPNLANLLRIRPAVGRTILPSDSDVSAAPVVLISYELWQGRLGGTSGVIGRTIRLNDENRIIVGVLPEGLQFPLERAPAGGTGSTLKAGLQSFWFPMRVHGDDRVSRGARMFLTVGRLGPNLTQIAARSELAALGQRLARDHPETNLTWNFDLVSFRDQILGQTRQGIPILAVAVAAMFSFAANRLLASQLFGLSPHDPILMMTVCVILSLVSLMASFIPARLAGMVDPMEALRHD